MPVLEKYDVLVCGDVQNVKKEIKVGDLRETIARWEKIFWKRIERKKE